MWGQGILIRLFMGGCFRRGGFRGWMGEVVGEWGVWEVGVCDILYLVIFM